MTPPLCRRCGLSAPRPHASASACIRALRSALEDGRNDVARLSARVDDLNACLEASDARAETAARERAEVVVELQRLRAPPPPPPLNAIEIPKCWNPPPEET